MSNKNDIKNTANDLKNQVKDAAHDLKNKAKDAAHTAENKVRDAAADAKRDEGGVASRLADKAERILPGDSDGDGK